MLFWRYKVAYEKSRNIRRNVASVAELRKSFFAEIDKVENREDLEKLREKYLGREKGSLTAVLLSLGGMPSVVNFNVLIARDKRRPNFSRSGKAGR